jgi:hypothetical protein
MTPEEMVELTSKGTDECTGRDVPQFNGARPATRSQGFAIRGESHLGDWTLISDL